MLKLAKLVQEIRKKYELQEQNHEEEKSKQQGEFPGDLGETSRASSRAVSGATGQNVEPKHQSSRPPCASTSGGGA